MTPLDHAILRAAKERAEKRRTLEAVIPAEMRFVKGWPTFQPSLEQCEQLASVRTQIGDLYKKEVGYVTAGEVYDRYAELRNHPRFHVGQGE